MTTKNNNFELPDDAIKKIRAVFANYGEIKKVLLYGSRAKGNNRFNSDIDLCIEGEALNLTLPPDLPRCIIQKNYSLFLSFTISS